MDSAEEALADVLSGRRADRLCGLARQLREVAGTLVAAGVYWFVYLRGDRKA